MDNIFFPRLGTFYYRKIKVDFIGVCVSVMVHKNFRTNFSAHWFDFFFRNEIIIKIIEKKKSWKYF